jgi:hypothetical protein
VEKVCNYLKVLVRPRGFEPLTFCSGGKGSIVVSGVFSERIIEIRKSLANFRPPSVGIVGRVWANHCTRNSPVILRFYHFLVSRTGDGYISLRSCAKAGLAGLDSECAIPTGAFRQENGSQSGVNHLA